jgi:hypothetical protein
MEASAGIYAIGSACGAIAGSPASSMFASWLGNWWAKRKLRKRLSALIMLKGVSTLCTKLTTSDVLFLDVDKLFQTLNVPIDAAADAAAQHTPRNPVDIILSYPVIRSHIVNVSSTYKGRIVLVSKSLELLHALPVRHEEITFACFSRACEDNIKVIYPNEAEHHTAEIEKYRILREIPETQMFVSDSLAELYKKVEEKYGVKRVQL